MELKEAYEILEIQYPIAKDVLKATYRRLVLKYHPDKGGTAYMFKKINDAYELVKENTGKDPSQNSEKSNMYDFNTRHQNTRRDKTNDTEVIATFKYYEGEWTVLIKQGDVRSGQTVRVRKKSGDYTYVTLDDYLDEDDYGEIYSFYSDRW